MKTIVTSEQVIAYLQALARKSKCPGIPEYSEAYQVGAASSIISSLINAPRIHRSYYRKQILNETKPKGT